MVVLSKLSINELLRVSKFNRALIPDNCVMCFRKGVTHDHFFHHYEVLRSCELDCLIQIFDSVS